MTEALDLKTMVTRCFETKCNPLRNQAEDIVGKQTESIADMERHKNVLKSESQVDKFVKANMTSMEEVMKIVEANECTHKCQKPATLFQ